MTNKHISNKRVHRRTVSIKPVRKLRLTLFSKSNSNSNSSSNSKITKSTTDRTPIQPVSVKVLKVSPATSPTVRTSSSPATCGRPTIRPSIRVDYHEPLKPSSSGGRRLFEDDSIQCVQFKKQVAVAVIPSCQDYCESTRRSMWRSERQIHAEAQRNRLEVRSEQGCDWRNYREDMMDLNGEAVHPYTYHRIMGQSIDGTSHDGALKKITTNNSSKITKKALQINAKKRASKRKPFVLSFPQLLPTIVNVSSDYDDVHHLECLDMF